MGFFGHRYSDYEDGTSSYLKCNGDIKVDVAADGTESWEIPKDFKWVGTEEEDGVNCPGCGEEIYYHNGEYICVSCESTFSKKELEDFCGCSITHG